MVGVGLDGEKKYNRYFHYLAQDSDLWGKLENALRTEAGLFLFSARLFLLLHLVYNL